MSGHEQGHETGRNPAIPLRGRDTEGQQRDLLDDLKRMQDQIAALPEPLRYIVLDPNWSPGLPPVVGHDARGRKYLLCSPAILDEMNRGTADSMGVAARLSAIPLYRLVDMPDGWPDA